MIIIITTRYSEGNIFAKCLESVRKVYPDGKIVIVDSNSDSFEHLEGINDLEIIYNNVNYMDGSLWSVYDRYPEEDSYLLLQDSVILKSQIPTEKEFAFFNTFPLNYNNGRYGNAMYEYFVKVTNYDGSYYPPIFGITFFIKNSLMKTLIEKFNMNKILPKNKIEMEASERIWGYFLTKLGMHLPDYAIIETKDFDDNKYFSKYFLDRQ